MSKDNASHFLYFLNAACYDPGFTSAADADDPTAIVNLDILIGANLTENLVVMVDNQSILRERSRWVDEGGRTFLTLSANPDILRMVIGRPRMRIEQGTATILCKIKSHRSEPLNETADDLAIWVARLTKSMLYGLHDLIEWCSHGWMDRRVHVRQHGTKE